MSNKWSSISHDRWSNLCTHINFNKDMLRTSKGIENALRNLQKDKDYKDVTLVCEDSQHLEGQKATLASSSPFLQRYISRSAGLHERREFDDLLAIQDFIDCGLEKKQNRLGIF